MLGGRGMIRQSLKTSHRGKEREQLRRFTPRHLAALAHTGPARRERGEPHHEGQRPHDVHTPFGAFLDFFSGLQGPTRESTVCFVPLYSPCSLMVASRS